MKVDPREGGDGLVVVLELVVVVGAAQVTVGINSQLSQAVVVSKQTELECDH